MATNSPPLDWRTRSTPASPLEKWRYNMKWGTAIDLSGCQAGKATDGRCDELQCMFRCEKKEAPENEMPTLALLCPRDKEYVDETGPSIGSSLV